MPGKIHETGSGGRGHPPGQGEQGAWDTHCKCLKVMSGKPVARDPEGERQRART